MPAAAASDGVVFVGHATLLIELDGARVLTDPLLRMGIAHVRRRVPLPDIADLLPLDAVLVSHAHADHLDPMSLRQVARDCPVIAPRGCAGLLRRSGVREVIEVEEGDRVDAGGIAVEAVHADHDGRRYPVGPPIAALGFLLDASTRIYFAGDTDLFDGMAELRPLDVALVPIWGWGPSLGPGHLDPRAAARAVALLQPRFALPIHWATYLPLPYRRGHPLLREPGPAFAAHVAELAPETCVALVRPGEALEL